MDNKFDVHVTSITANDKIDDEDYEPSTFSTNKRAALPNDAEDRQKGQQSVILSDRVDSLAKVLTQSAANSALWEMQKLSHGNYISWSLEMEKFLTDMGLWHVIKHEAPAEKDATWLENDEVARAAIVLRIEICSLYLILHTKSAREAWNSIKNQHHILCKCYLRKLKFDESNDMEEHINQFKRLINELKVFEEISEHRVIELLIETLPQLYQGSVQDLLKTEDMPKGETLMYRVECDLIATHTKRKLLQDQRDA